MYNLVDPNTKLAAICFNGGKPNLFRVQGSSPLIDSVGRLQSIQMMLTHDDVRSMFLIFGQYNMFSTIELDVSLLRSSEDILNSLIQLDEDV